MESQILAKDPGLESERRASLLGHSRQRGFPVCSCQFSTNLRIYGATPGGEADEHTRRRRRRRNTGFGELVTFRDHVMRLFLVQGKTLPHLSKVTCCKQNPNKQSRRNCKSLTFFL